MLSDPKLRNAYDSRGQDAVDAAPKMDAGKESILFYAVWCCVVRCGAVWCGAVRCDV